MSRIATLTKPVRRQMGKLVITIAEPGLTVRVKGRRKDHQVTWLQVLGLVDCREDRPAARAADEVTGARVLKALGGRKR